jgi:RNA polymerase sigma-70 factor (ECF subfamily)
MDGEALIQLLARVALRDRAALRQLYEQTSPRLMAVAYRLLGDRAAAEDVLQEVFVTVWTRAAQMPALRSHPLAWLTSMVRNRSIDLLRAAKPEVPLQWQDADGSERQHDIASEGLTPPEQMLQQQADHALSKCLSHLEPEPRQAVLLSYYEGLTHFELAERMRRPLGTIKAWVRRSLMRLKDCLEGEGAAA